jgi:diaminohydroxyphosphoribosylaminopyrimidine deaminase/5-amino-6-(5-phosphoribosylamino)uracil reductase
MPRRTAEDYMRRAVALSRRGLPAPNPHVGCVIVKDDEVVGEGYHAFTGGPHAEIVALKAAGERSNGAAAYVTLEPCNHEGRTPPCSQALLSAGIKKVVFAVSDPNPKADGGAEFLTANAVEVISGVLAEEAEAANHRWLAAMRLRRPYIALKAAMSLDGRVALPNGESKWITGERARRAARRLRAEMGAVLVGSGTVLADEPKLDARGVSGAKFSPFRIVLDPEGEIPEGHSTVANPERLLWIVGHEPRSAGQIQCHVVKGVFDPAALMALLWRHGVTSMLVEGGPRTIRTFVECELYDELHVFVGAKALGDGPGWLNGIGPESISGAAEFRLKAVRRLDSDVHLAYEPAK